MAEAKACLMTRHQWDVASQSVVSLNSFLIEDYLCPVLFAIALILIYDFEGKP